MGRTMGKYEFDFGYGMFCIIKAFGFRKSSLPDKANHLTPKYEEIRFCDKYMVYAEQWLNDSSDDKKTSVQVASDFAQDRDRIIDVVWAFRLHLREKLCGIASEYGDDAGKREKVVKYQSFQLDDSDILEAARNSYSESDLVKFALVADKTLTWLDTIGELVEVVVEDQQGAERVELGKGKEPKGKRGLVYKWICEMSEDDRKPFITLHSGDQQFYDMLYTAKDSWENQYKKSYPDDTKEQFRSAVEKGKQLFKKLHKN